MPTLLNPAALTTLSCCPAEPSCLNWQVDDLESIDALEQYIDASATIMIFVSQGVHTASSAPQSSSHQMHVAQPSLVPFARRLTVDRLLQEQARRCPCNAPAVPFCSPPQHLGACDASLVPTVLSVCRDACTRQELLTRGALHT